MTMQVVAALSNNESLCIGEITAEEAFLAHADSQIVDGLGLYLVSVDTQRPSDAGQVLAKFTSEDAARKLAQFFRLSGRMEYA